MPLPRNKQLAVYMLLCTRSAYRAQLEGAPTLGRGGLPEIGTKDDLRTRFTTVSPPAGLTISDMQALVASGTPISDLYVPNPNPGQPNPTPGQFGNISFDPALIAGALQMTYDPTDPECPAFKEGDLISAFTVVANVGN